MKMRLTLLLLAVQIASIISQDVPQPTLVCRGVGCSQALAPVSPFLQQRFPSGLVQTCFFNRCQISQSPQFSQISGPGFFSSQSCFGGSCSQSFSSSSSFQSPGTQTRALSRQASPVARQAGFGGFGGANIFGPGGTFSQIFG